MCEKLTDPTTTLWPQIFPRRDPCKREDTFIAWNSLPAESLGWQPCPAMCCVLWGSEVQTLRRFLPEPRMTTRDHIRAAGTATPLGTHLTVHLWVPGFPVALRIRYPGSLHQLGDEGARKNNPKELVLAALALSFLFLKNQWRAGSVGWPLLLA